MALHEVFGENCPGGSTKVFHETSRRLAAAGHRVTAISRIFPPGSAVPDDGVEYLRYEDIEGASLPRRFNHYKRGIRGLFQKAVAERTPDVVIVHSTMAALGITDALAALDAPVVNYFHSPWHMEYESAMEMDSISGLRRLKTKFFSNVRRRLEKKCLRAADGFVTLSNSMRDIALGVHPFLEDTPSTVIHGAADTGIFHPAENQEEKRGIRERFTLPSDRFIIISSRRMVPRTGLDTLIAAFAVASSRLPKGTVLLLTGDGPIREHLRELALELGVGQQVVFTGHVPIEDLAALYRASDLFVMPTRELEGFGLSTVEAMASGLPAIGTDIGGTGEILGRVSKELLIPDASAEALEKKLLEFANKPDLEEWGALSLEFAKRLFNWDRHAEALLEFARGLRV